MIAVPSTRFTASVAVGDVFHKPDIPTFHANTVDAADAIIVAATLA